MALPELSRTIFEQALENCAIELAFEQKVEVVSASDNAKMLFCGSNSIELGNVKRIRIIALGKASRAMLESLLRRLPFSMHKDLAGVVIGHTPPDQLPHGFEFFAGGHPFPNESSFAGARAVLSLLQALGKDVSDGADALCMFLISGGASAMMELPLDQSITLEDTIAFHRALVHSGATITEMNCLRKHFSAVKGGRLSLAAKDSKCFTVLVSDVPVDRLDSLASGPTMPDTSTVEECREILLRYSLLERFPLSVQRFFRSTDLPETVKPKDLVTRTCTLLDADDLAEAARLRAERLGFYATIDNTCDDWEYRPAAEYLLARIRALRREHPRACLISTGEIGVRLPTSAAGNGGYMESVAGIGGRNQHFALYTATLLEASDSAIAVLSAGSDGIDGNSLAAGAVVDEQTLVGENTDESDELRAEAQRALHHYSSSTFLEKRGATITTGPTGNNLRDLRILLADHTTTNQLNK